MPRPSICSRDEKLTIIWPVMLSSFCPVPWALRKDDGPGRQELCRHAGYPSLATSSHSLAFYGSEKHQGVATSMSPTQKQETLSLLSEPLQLSAYECTPIKYSFGIPLASFPLSGQTSHESPSNSACYALNPQDQGFGGEDTLLCSPSL